MISHILTDNITSMFIYVKTTLKQQIYIKACGGPADIQSLTYDRLAKSLYELIRNMDLYMYFILQLRTQTLFFFFVHVCVSVCMLVRKKGKN